jgi:hypothetical protein
MGGTMRRPKLLARALVKNSRLLIEDGDHTFVVDSSDEKPGQLIRALLLMDGRRSLAQICRLSGTDPNVMRNLVDALASQGLVHETKDIQSQPALKVLFELEDIANQYLHESVYRNVFWNHLLKHPMDVPLNVFYGMAIENYHFLFRESYFDAPALNYPASTRARVLMNEFYGEEFGHDELVLNGLRAIGVSREDLADTIPLPGTMALCNALSFWARYDSVFFFSTLGVLEGKDLQVDSFVQACEERGLSESFIKPIRAHAEINIKSEHGSLTRAIFAHLPSMSNEEILRMRAQTRLFVRLYDGFYKNIWDHYSRSAVLLRRVSVIEGVQNDAT